MNKPSPMAPELPDTVRSTVDVAIVPPSRMLGRPRATHGKTLVVDQTAGPVRAHSPPKTTYNVPLGDQAQWRNGFFFVRPSASVMRTVLRSRRRALLAFGASRHCHTLVLSGS